MCVSVSLLRTVHCETVPHGCSLHQHIPRFPLQLLSRWIHWPAGPGRRSCLRHRQQTGWHHAAVYGSIQHEINLDFSWPLKQTSFSLRLIFLSAFFFSLNGKDHSSDSAFVFKSLSFLRYAEILMSVTVPTMEAAWRTLCV